MLENPFYAGLLNVPKWRVSRRGDFVPLVPEQTFLQVQHLLKGSSNPVRSHA